MTKINTLYNGRESGLDNHLESSSKRGASSSFMKDIEKLEKAVIEGKASDKERRIYLKLMSYNVPFSC
jgi:hypothetical protein